MIQEAESCLITLNCLQSIAKDDFILNVQFVPLTSGPRLLPEEEADQENKNVKRKILTLNLLNFYTFICLFGYLFFHGTRFLNEK